jgi:hypothetical protein
MTMSPTELDDGDHPDIYVCGPSRIPWPELWKTHQSFG